MFFFFKCVCVCVCVGQRERERKGETDRQIGRARPDGIPHIANCEARGPIMHTERVSFINYPTVFLPLYAHKDSRVSSEYVSATVCFHSG